MKIKFHIHVSFRGRFLKYILLRNKHALIPKFLKIYFLFKGRIPYFKISELEILDATSL